MTTLTLKQIEDLDFWRQISPTTQISDSPFQDTTEAFELDNAGKEKIRTQIIHEGYFHTPPVLDRGKLEKLRQIVLELDQRGIMPMFLSLYDEFWQTLHQLRKTFTPILLDNYKLTSNFWIWHIPASDAERGWKPHRDGGMHFSSIRNDGTPTLATAWIPLTDVTTENSCMYVLPRNYDLIFQDFARRRAGQPGIENARQSPIPLQSVRALPVNAGEIIGWDTNILHWGSGSSRWAVQPRISIGVYYEASDATDISNNPDNDSKKRFIDFASPLTFEDRLRIIANMIQTYAFKFKEEEETEKHFSALMTTFSEKWK